MKKDKKLSPSQIAKWFINHVDREAGDDITHLKLQKLLYYSQAWHLANYNESLFEEDMQAWTHGPVVPSVWQEYKDYEWQSLPPHNEEIQIEGIEDYLNTVYESYGKFTAKKLEKMTHEELPWKKTRGNIPLEQKCTKPIKKDLMRDYYGKKINKKPS